MADTKISALAVDASLGGTEQVPLNDAGTNKRTTTQEIADLSKGLPLGLTGAEEATRYVGATTTGAPASGTFAVGDFVITHAGQVYVCTTAGSPGTWTQIGAGGGGAIRVEDEGSSIVAAATGINFAGAGVTVTDAGSNEALVTIAGGGGSAAIDHKFARRTSGNLSLNSTTWAAVDTGMDLVLDVAAGDVIECSMSGRCNNQNVFAFFDVLTVVSGTLTNSFATGAAKSDTTNGVAGWVAEASTRHPLGCVVHYAIQAGDIVSGQVTLRLCYRTSAASIKTLYATTADLPLEFSAKNIGPVAT